MKVAEAHIEERKKLMGVILSVAEDAINDHPEPALLTVVLGQLINIEGMLAEIASRLPERAA